MKKTIPNRFDEIHGFAKSVLSLSVALMAALYICSIICYLIAPYAPDYFRAIGMHLATLEAAPAVFASGVCAAVISDLALRTYGVNSDK